MEKEREIEGGNDDSEKDEGGDAVIGGVKPRETHASVEGEGDEKDEIEVSIKTQLQPQEKAIFNTPLSRIHTYSKRHALTLKKLELESSQQVRREKSAHLEISSKERQPNSLSREQSSSSVNREQSSSLVRREKSIYDISIVEMSRKEGRSRKLIGRIARPARQKEIVESSKEPPKSDGEPKDSVKETVPVAEDIEDENGDAQGEAEEVEDKDEEAVSEDEVAADKGEGIDNRDQEGEAEGEVTQDKDEDVEDENKDVQDEVEAPGDKDEEFGDRDEEPDDRDEELEAEQQVPVKDQVARDNGENNKDSDEEVEVEYKEPEEDHGSETESVLESLTNESYEPRAVQYSRKDAAGNIEILVQWKGYPLKTDWTWENTERLRESCPDFVKEWEQRPQPPSTTIYVVDKIVDKLTKKDGKVKYKVKWEGSTNRYNTWEPAEILELDVPHLVEDFENQYKKMGKKRKAGIPDDIENSPQPNAKRGRGRPRKPR